MPVVPKALIGPNSKKRKKAEKSVADDNSIDTQKELNIEANSKRFKVDAKFAESQRYKHRFAMVCRSNMNRSMANHSILLQYKFDVVSYGIGKEVKVPSRDKKGRTFPFGTPYQEMLDFLVKDDEEFNNRTKVIPMLHRNVKIKKFPQDFREIPSDFLRTINVIVCSEFDIFERVVEGEPLHLPILTQH